MAFTVEDFHDLIRILAERPEWRAELRRHVLTDELVELPALVKQLAEAQSRTEARVGELIEAQARAESRLERVEAAIEALTEAQARTEARVGELTEAQARTEEALRDLVEWHSRVEDRLGDLDGRMLELDFARKGTAYLSPIARRLRVVEFGSLADLLDEAIDEGRMSEADRNAIMRSDIVLSGRRRQDGQEVYLVVEISGGIRPHDVERAVERAALLETLGRPVLPVVAGRRIHEDAAALARVQGTWAVVEGRGVTPPADI